MRSYVLEFVESGELSENYCRTSDEALVWAEQLVAAKLNRRVSSLMRSDWEPGGLNDEGHKLFRILFFFLEVPGKHADDLLIAQLVTVGCPEPKQTEIVFGSSKDGL